MEGSSGGVLVRGASDFDFIPIRTIILSFGYAFDMFDDLICALSTLARSFVRSGFGEIVEEPSSCVFRKYMWLVYLLVKFHLSSIILSFDTLC